VLAGKGSRSKVGAKEGQVFDVSLFSPRVCSVELPPSAHYSITHSSPSKLREVVETPLLTVLTPSFFPLLLLERVLTRVCVQPERFIALGIDPPKGVMLFGPPGTGKTLCARAVANRTDATFIRVIGSELVQKYVGEGARMVRELFEMARSKKSCIIFFDEIDAIGGARSDDGAGTDNEVQRTMLELINQLDGFDARGNIKVLMATNRCVSLSRSAVFSRRFRRFSPQLTSPLRSDPTLSTPPSSVPVVSTVVSSSAFPTTKDALTSSASTLARSSSFLPPLCPS
jgi:Cdc6-like AAA superfamily ATPase